MASEIYEAQALLSGAEYLLDALQEKCSGTAYVSDSLEGIKVILNTADDMIENYINKELEVQKNEEN